MNKVKKLCYKQKSFANYDKKRKEMDASQGKEEEDGPGSPPEQLIEGLTEKQQAQVVSATVLL